MQARTTRSLTILLLAAAPAPALAQSKPSFSAEKDAYHGFNITLPIASLSGETIIHMEANLAGQAALALEGTFKPAFEEISEEDALATGETRQSTAQGVSLLFSRYTSPASMAGMYFSLGLGYREEEVKWGVRPDPKDKQVNMSLVNADSRLYHDARLSGTTGHLRFGYRYVGQEWPFVGGIYLGARHFQSAVKDGDGQSLKDDKEQVPVTAAPMTDRERERARRLYASRPECGIEVGFRF